MLSMTNAVPNVEVGDQLPLEYIDQHWYAAYTRPRHEKRVAAQLEGRGVEFFLPLYGTVRRWKNGRHTVELPLFPNYVFVRIAVRNRMEVLQLPSVVSLVGFNGLPFPLPDGEIEKLRVALDQRMRAQPHPYLTVGQRVRIRSGSLVGLEGLLVRWKNTPRVVVSVHLIMRSFAAEVAIADIEPIF